MSPNTTESWLALWLTLAVAVWPFWVWAGMVWGRMQAEDEASKAAERSRPHSSRRKAGR